MIKEAHAQLVSMPVLASFGIRGLGGLGGMSNNNSCSYHQPSRLLKCPLLKDVLKEYLETVVGLKYSSLCTFKVPDFGSAYQ